jgi:hypothetical protein
MHYFKKLSGESLMESWYIIQEIVEKSTCRYSPHLILTRFHDGLDVWSKLVLDTLTYGRFTTRSAHFFNLVMLNLFGNLGKPKEEIEVQQLKKSLEEALVSLQNSIEVVASKMISIKLVTV